MGQHGVAFRHLFGSVAENKVRSLAIPAGNLWLLKVGGENHNSIFFWDHGSYDTFDETELGNWPRIATSFQEFRDKLTAFRAAEDRAVPSRYALVMQAVKAISKQDPGFSPRAHPDFAWHCDCDDDGNVKMHVGSVCSSRGSHAHRRLLALACEKGPDHRRPNAATRVEAGMSSC